MNLKDDRYDPNKFVDYLVEMFHVKNDAALSRAHERLNVPTLKLRKMMVTE